MPRGYYALQPNDKALRLPPHGGFAIGLERLTAQILNLPDVRQATLYPRDRTKLTPQESPPHKFRWLRRLDLNDVQIQSAWEGAESVAKEAKVVPGARIELATPAFSGRRSTSELPRHAGVC